MVDRVVLINGLPGSGKTTLATQLAPVLSASLISKDAIKEAVADAVPAIASEALGWAVGDLIWTLTATMPGTVLLESWWFKPRDRRFVEAGLLRCRLPRVVEIWCDVPPDLAWQRYSTRHRHRIHDDNGRRPAESWPRWASEGQPLDVGAVVRVRTDRPVDVPALAATVAASFGDPTPTPPASAAETGEV